MKVKDLIFRLRNLDPESDLVIQKQDGPEYFSLHHPVLQPRGHIGHKGPILHIGNNIHDDPEKTESRDN